MIAEKTELEGVLLITPEVFKDNRGYFLESFNEIKYEKIGIKNNFVQDNISSSVKGT